MRVTTIDGGFRGRPDLRVLQGGRGLGSLTTTQQNAEAEAFLARFARFDRMTLLVHRALVSGAVPIPAAAELEGTFLAIGAERTAHLARLSTLESEAQLVEWRSTGDTVAGHAAAAADRAGVLVGDEAGARPWKIVVALVGGALVFGGAAFVFGRMK